MKNTLSLHHSIPMVGFIGLLCCWMIFDSFLRPLEWKNEHLHSSIEALGALASIFMCIVLIRKQRTAEGENMFLVAMGFLSMGTLDGFHSICPPGQEFVFLHSLAALTGGLGFIFVWSPAINSYAANKKQFPLIVGGSAVALGVWALSFPETLPQMVDRTNFTALAIMINLASGVLFLAAGMKFLIESFRTGKIEKYMLTVLTFLFGLSGVVFESSVLWDDEWWLWHLLRLMAYLFALTFMIRGYYMLQAELLQHRERLEELVDERTQELKKTNAQLDLEIIEHKKTEASLRESEVKYRSMMEAMLDPVYINSPDYLIEYMNPAMIQRVGSDVDGVPCHEVMHGLNEKCPWCIHKKVINGESLNYELTSPKDEKIYFVSNSPVFHTDGSVSKLSIYKDITDHKKIEAQFHQAQKMESIGRLAGGVAHDYNNALAAIIGFTELAQFGLDPDVPLNSHLDEILAAAIRARDVTHQLLAFARKQTIAPRVLDVNKHVEDMLKMLQRLIGEDIDLAWRPRAKLWPVFIDPSQIDQVLVNLCVNARDAIDGVGLVTVETRNITFDEVYCTDHAGFIPGEFVMLAVSDNGCGMEIEIKANIFEPFFTTKGSDKGTGLGMATVYGIVKQNHGFINVYTEPGKGTTFKIYLPRHRGEASSIRTEESVEIPQGRGENILLVEDDHSILNLTGKMLDGLGYGVISAATPGEALGLAKEHAGKIHLLVTDVIMPEMNGRLLGNRLQSICPDIRCLFMSGYTDNVIAHHGVLDSGVHFLHKPFSRTDLATKVRLALDETTDHF